MNREIYELLYKYDFEEEKIIELKSRDTYIVLNKEEIIVAEDCRLVLRSKIDEIKDIEVKRVLGGGASILFSGRYGGDTSLYNVIYRDFVLKVEGQEKIVEINLQTGDDSLNMASEEKVKVFEKEFRNRRRDFIFKKSYKHYFK